MNCAGLLRLVCKPPRSRPVSSLRHADGLPTETLTVLTNDVTHTPVRRSGRHYAVAASRRQVNQHRIVCFSELV